MTALVTGATGFTGGHMARTLAARGERVRAIVRPRSLDKPAVAALRALGIEVEELPDGARIQGGSFSGGMIDSRGDHRVAMAFAVGAARAAGPVRILDTANVATSFPGFVSQAAAVGLAIKAERGD